MTSFAQVSLSGTKINFAASPTVDKTNFAERIDFYILFWQGSKRLLYPNVSVVEDEGGCTLQNGKVI